MKRYVADLFAGSKRVARAARRLGVEARTWELEDGPSNDLTRWGVEQALHQDIEVGNVVGASLAGPEVMAVDDDESEVMTTEGGAALLSLA